MGYNRAKHSWIKTLRWVLNMTCACMCAHTHTHACAQTYTHMCMHTHIYTHTHAMFNKKFSCHHNKIPQNDVNVKRRRRKNTNWLIRCLIIWKREQIMRGVGQLVLNFSIPSTTPGHLSWEMRGRQTESERKRRERPVSRKDYSQFTSPFA